MTRQTWLSGSVIALLGLSGLLCGLACLEDIQTGAPAAIASEMPCHEQSPSEPSDLGHDCDCSASSALAALPTFDLPTQLAGVVLRVPALRAIARLNTPERFAMRAERIPPTDLLLQKSTLIV